MKIVLSKNAYGKNRINLSKIIRHEGHHEFRQISVNTLLEGDFETVHTHGDNSKIVATDTQKNTVYALAKEHFTSSVEAFGIKLAHHFMNANNHLTSATIEITEHGWKSLQFESAAHPHAYISGGAEKRTTAIVHNRNGITVSSGIKDLLILKTTDSAFEGFLRDEYTTLKETADRILSTQMEALWVYTSADVDFTTLYQNIRSLLLQTFAFHKSLSVQQTLYAMGEAVLQAYAEVKEISIIMPNRHHIPFNLEPFGMENNNEIFIATDEPYGYITATVVRSPDL